MTGLGTIRFSRRTLSHGISWFVRNVLTPSSGQNVLSGLSWLKINFFWRIVTVVKFLTQRGVLGIDEVSVPTPSEIILI